jgi:hypothetical protein
MLPIRNNASRSKMLIILFVAVIVLKLGFIVMLSWQYEIEETLRRGETATNLQFYFNMRNTLLYLGWIISVCLIICFIRWFWRAYKNIHAIPGAKLSLATHWAITGWFVPVLNFFRPYQIMREIWEQTQQAITHRLSAIQSLTQVSIWWIANLLLIVCYFFSFRLIENFYRLPFRDYSFSVYIDMCFQVISIVVIAISIKMVKRMQVFEKELYLEAQQPGDSVFSLVTSPGATPIQS